MQRPEDRTLGSDFTIDLRQLGSGDLALAGGKGANLGELMHAGFPVPAGFVVTTAAYDSFVAHNRLDEIIGDTLRKEETSGAAIREAFESAPIPPVLKRSILAAYEHLGAGPVAVRSSATAEDLPQAAFAGQQDTFLNVVGVESFFDAVRRSWASLWTDRAIAYRAHQAIDQHLVKLAVVVQKMVMADVAGVLFTANPVTGARDEIVVESSAGLGEAVVSGQVTPEHIVLRKGTWGWRIAERRAGRHELIISAQPGGGTQSTPGTPDSSTLPDSALRGLAKLGRAIERHYGRPEDVEWAWAEGKLFILQARPITALPEPLRPPSGPERLVGNLIGEMLPTRPYPLDVTAWMPALFSVIAPLFSLVGMKITPFQALFAGEDGISVQPPSALEPRPTPALLLAPFRIGWFAVRYDPLRWHDDPLLVEAQTRARTLAARDLSALSSEALLDTLDGALAFPAILGEIRRRYFPRAVLAAGLLRATLGLLRRGKHFSALFFGGENETMAANRALEALARRIRSDPALADIFKHHEPGELWAALEGHPSGQAFLTDIRGFLDRYGHREAAALLISKPTWKDAPDVVLGMLKGFAQAEPEPRSGRPSWEAARDAVLAHPLLRLPLARRAFLALLAEARTLLPLREDTHFYATMAMPIVRRTALEMGRRLAEAHVLDTPEDVFHLTRRELEHIDGTWPLPSALAGQLRSRALERKERRAVLERTPYVDARRPHRADVMPGRALVSGTPGSPGVVEGPVRVIRDETEFNKLRAGDVLVAPFTNPSWTPLFERAIAVVVDSGGAMSHAAIVAREYGIPAVMGTTNGTYILTDDQQVQVDGNQGLVFPRMV